MSESVLKHGNHRYIIQNQIKDEGVNISYFEDIELIPFFPIRFIPLIDTFGGVMIKEITLRVGDIIVFSAQGIGTRYYKKNEAFIIDNEVTGRGSLSVEWTFVNVADYLFEKESISKPYEVDDGVFHFLLSTDDNYLLPTVVCINSVIESNYNLNLFFHIFHNGISQANIEFISKWMEEKGNNVRIDFRYIREEDYCFPVREGDPVTTVTYLRLLAPNIFDKGIKKVLYLDGDIVVTGDIRDLYDINIDGYGAAFVKGKQPEDRKDTLGLFEEDIYFNSGVMLMNLDYWREHSITEKCLRFIQNYPHLIPVREQDTMNAILAGQVFLVPEKWNTGIGTRKRDIRYQEEPVILHYTHSGIHKPWYRNSISKWKDVFLKYMKGSPYSYADLSYCDYENYLFKPDEWGVQGKVILYGAGDVGQDLHYQNIKYKWFQEVSWIDKNYSEIKESCREVNGDIYYINTVEHDAVLVAVLNEEIYKSIKAELKKLGEAEEKIVWSHPIKEIDN